MGFWIFMFIVNLFIPIIMIGFGSYFIKKAPKEINMVFGYRTDMSMKNKDTWVFAHNYCGKLMLIIGFVMLIPSIFAMIFAFGKDINFVSTFGLIICGIQMVFLIIPIIPTEIALKKNFDENGNRKNL